MYNTIPSIKEKDDFVVEMTKSVFDPNFTTEGPENIKKFVHDLVGYYVIMEGIFFYAGFAMMLSMLRKNRMVGVGEQFQFILRDESVHLAFGADLINTIVQENPDIWTDEFKDTLTKNIMRGVELEKRYADDALPRGIVGLTPSTVKQYVEHVADRRLERIGLKRQYHKDNPFPWLSEVMDMPKEKNFFETRVTEYKTGELDWQGNAYPERSRRIILCSSPHCTPPPWCGEYGAQALELQARPRVRGLWSGRRCRSCTLFLPWHTQTRGLPPP